MKEVADVHTATSRNKVDRIGILLHLRPSLVQVHPSTPPDSQKWGDTEDDRSSWAPMRKVIFGSDEALGGGTRSVAVNNQWDQARMEAAGYVEESIDKCHACDMVRGSFFHRHFPE